MEGFSRLLPKSLDFIKKRTVDTIKNKEVKRIFKKRKETNNTLYPCYKRRYNNEMCVIGFVCKINYFRSISSGKRRNPVKVSNLEYLTL